MVKLQQNHSKKVQLSENVIVLTPLDESCIPALRAGFAGYTANPRWNAVKFHAWKIGRQWRQAYAEGTMVVRSTDGLLVPVEEAESIPPQQSTTQSTNSLKWYQRISVPLSSRNHQTSDELTLV
ncbi:MAG: hypothetical protein WBA13_07580 [Microcoleaceae cyanobacterium]